MRSQVVGTKSRRSTPQRATVAADRLATGVTQAAKAANLLQLRRTKGQIDGIERMLKEYRYCADIIVQITAARASLLVVARALLKEHLKACHDAATSNGGSEVDDMYQELVELVSKMAR